MNSFWIRQRDVKRGFLLTHLFLDYETPAGALISRTVVADTYCLNRELEDFLFAYVKQWSLVNYRQEIVSGKLSCERCVQAFEPFKLWLSRGGKPRVKTVRDIEHERRRKQSERWCNILLARKPK